MATQIHKDIIQKLFDSYQTDFLGRSKYDKQEKAILAVAIALDGSLYSYKGNPTIVGDEFFFDTDIGKTTYIDEARFRGTDTGNDLIALGVNEKNEFVVAHVEGDEDKASKKRAERFLKRIPGGTVFEQTIEAMAEVEKDFGVYWTLKNFDDFVKFVGRHVMSKIT